MYYVSSFIMPANIPINIQTHLSPSLIGKRKRNQGDDNGKKYENLCKNQFWGYITSNVKRTHAFASVNSNERTTLILAYFDILCYFYTFPPNFVYICRKLNTPIIETNQLNEPFVELLLLLYPNKIAAIAKKKKIKSHWKSYWVGETVCGKIIWFYGIWREKI